MEHTVEPTSFVAGHEKVTAIFGEWPSFHDAEVLSVRLERLGNEGRVGPVLYAVVHVFAWDCNPTYPKGVKFTKHTVVTFRFNGVIGLELLHFNHQNAIFDLIFERPPEAPDVAPYQVTFDSAAGMDCCFFCAGAEIVTVESGVPKDSVHTEGRSM